MLIINIIILLTLVRKY